MIDPDKERAFLDALTKLSREHGITIRGCGCFGSPSLEEELMPEGCTYHSTQGGSSDFEIAKICEACGAWAQPDYCRTCGRFTEVLE